MENLELKFISSISGRPSKNKGDNVPPWNNNHNDRGSWYAEGSYSYFYNMIENDPNRIYIQYGQNNENWASGRFFVQELNILEQNINSDNSITVKARSRMKSFAQRKRDGLEEVGFHVIYNFKVFGNTVFDYEGNAGDTITESSSPWYEQTFTIQPEETEERTGIEWSITYPEGQVSDSNLFIGFGLYNPNPKSYVPMTTRKNGTWKDLNSNNGKIKIRKNNSWIDKSEENASTSKQENKGKNRIRKNGKWYQLPEMEGANIK